MKKTTTNRSFVKFRLKAVGILILFLICLLRIPSYADGLNILMFLWQGETNAEKGFKEALAEEFFDQNINYTVLDVYKDLNRLKRLIDETNQSQYQLIYTYGSAITSKAAKAFQTTPIVFNIVFDPIGYKIAESWDKKQANLTGVSNSIPIQFQIQKMQEVFGKGDMGIIYNPLDKKSVKIKKAMEDYLAQTGGNLIPFEFNNNFSPLRSYLSNINNRVKCIYLPSERLLTKYIHRIMAEVNRKKIPTCVNSKTYLRKGALLCINAEYYKMGRLAGKYSAQILRGIKPADLPIERPSESDIELYANASIVKRFRIQLPQDLNIIYVKNEK